MDIKSLFFQKLCFYEVHSYLPAIINIFLTTKFNVLNHEHIYHICMYTLQKKYNTLTSTVFTSIKLLDSTKCDRLYLTSYSPLSEMLLLICTKIHSLPLFLSYRSHKTHEKLICIFIWSIQSFLIINKRTTDFLCSLLLLYIHTQDFTNTWTDDSKSQDKCVSGEETI